MSAQLDNVKFNPTLGGLTDWVFSSIVASYQSPVGLAVNGRSYCFFALDASNNWELADGTWNSGTSTFARTNIRASSTGAKVNFPAAPTVSIVSAKADMLSIEEANTFTSVQKAQGRANLDVLKKNYLLNGAMMVSQENPLTAGTTNNYFPVDQFQVSFSNAGTVSIAQVASATPGGSPNRLRVTVTSADATVGSGDFLDIIQPIEGLRVADLRIGSASAKTATVQFGCKGPAGTYCVAIRNGATNRSYPAEFVISGGEANTDVVKSVTIPLDTAGTWAVDNTAGLIVSWALMAGSSAQGTVNTWNAANNIATSNQFNFMGTNGNVFELFDVSMCEGNVCPTYSVSDVMQETFLCNRYFHIRRASSITDFIAVLQSFSTTGAWGKLFDYPIEMRIVPTITISNTAHMSGWGSAGTASAVNAFTIGGWNSTKSAAVGNIGVAAGAHFGFGGAGVGLTFNNVNGWIASNARM